MRSKAMGEKGKSVVTYVRLAPDIAKKLDEMAEEEVLDRSSLIRRIVVKSLRNGATA